MRMILGLDIKGTSFAHIIEKVGDLGESYSSGSVISPKAQFPPVSPICCPSRWEHPESALPLGSKRAARGPQGMCCYVYAQQEIKHLRSSISYAGPENN